MIEESSSCGTFTWLREKGGFENGKNAKTDGKVPPWKMKRRNTKDYSCGLKFSIDDRHRAEPESLHRGRRLA